MKRRLTPEEKTERDSQNAAFARYYAEPGRWALPEKGDDGLWHLRPWTPPPRSPTGYAPPFREEAPEPTPGPQPEPPRMSMADYQAGRRPVQEQPVPPPMPKPTKATTTAEKRAQREAAEARQKAAQGSML